MSNNSASNVQWRFNLCSIQFMISEKIQHSTIHIPIILPQSNNNRKKMFYFAYLSLTQVLHTISRCCVENVNGKLVNYVIVPAQIWARRENHRCCKAGFEIQGIWILLLSSYRFENWLTVWNRNRIHWCLESIFIVHC